MAEHNLDDYIEFKDSKKKFTKVDIILLFSFFTLISFLFFKFVNNSDTINSNLKTLTHNFTKIENNKLIILNNHLDLNKNLYILELYRFGNDSCLISGYMQSLPKMGEFRLFFCILIK